MMLNNKLIEDGVSVPTTCFKGIPYRIALENKFYHVKDYFYSGRSDMWGLQCQYIDSCIMEILLEEFMALGICCIPIHDGIIIPRNKMKIAKIIMEKAWFNDRKTSSPDIKREY